MIEAIKKFGARVAENLNPACSWKKGLPAGSDQTMLAHYACIHAINNFFLNGDGATWVKKIHKSADDREIGLDLGLPIGGDDPPAVGDYGEYRVEAPNDNGESVRRWVIITRNFGAMTEESLQAMSDRDLERIINEDEERLFGLQKKLRK